MSKYLVTGGAGFIGSNLVKKLSQDGENQIIVIDNLSMGLIENITPASNVQIIEGDVCDERLMEETLASNQFDFIYHLAAVASVADSIERPVETHRTNFDSVLNLLELAKKYQPNLKRLLFSSSAAVYGDEATLPKHEESVIRPLNAYAIDKFAAERFVLTYNSLYGLPTTAVRFLNVYGPNQNPGSPYSGVISIVLDKFENDAPFTLFGDGEQTRDFVYVDDVVAAITELAEKEETLGQVYNVGTGKETSVNKLIETFEKLLDKKLEVKHEAARKGDIKKSVCDNSKLRSVGITPATTIEEGLKKYLESK